MAGAIQGPDEHVQTAESSRVPLRPHRRRAPRVQSAVAVHLCACSWTLGGQMLQCVLSVRFSPAHSVLRTHLILAYQQLFHLIAEQYLTVRLCYGLVSCSPVGGRRLTADPCEKPPGPFPGCTAPRSHQQRARFLSLPDTQDRGCAAAALAVVTWCHGSDCAAPGPMVVSVSVSSLQECLLRPFPCLLTSNATNDMVAIILISFPFSSSVLVFSSSAFFWTIFILNLISSVVFLAVHSALTTARLCCHVGRLRQHS